MSDACKKLLASGPEVRGRPQSYVQSHQLDLDSYVNVVQAIKLRVSLRMYFALSFSNEWYY